jgi:hypothetical protein
MKIPFTFLFLMAFLAGFSQVNNAGGTITVENGATLVIEGSYTSTSSGTIEIDGQVNLKGDFINNSGSIATGSTGRLSFTGSAAQAITGSASTTFFCAVEVNNSTGVALTTGSTGNSQVLDSTLILTSGKVTLNGFNLELSNEGVSGADATKYLVTNSTGKVKALVGASNYTFPVGNASFNPVILNEAGTSDTYSVSFADSYPSGWTGTTNAVLGYWDISDANGGGNNLAVTTQWNASQEQAPFDRTDCAVGLQISGNNISWKSSGAAVANGSAWTRIGSGFTGVGKFMVGDYFFEGIDLDLDVFLAGPYSSGTMSTALRTAGVIQLTSPYGTGESVASIPAGVVDWIKVELRDPVTPGTIVKSYSFFVDNAGNVLNTTGTVGTKLTGVAKGSYYVAVKHRNHLGVMTASTINFSAAGPFAFDFTAGSGLYGTNAERSMGSGKWALWAGNTDGNNSVQFATGTSDITPISSAVLGDAGNTTSDPSWYNTTPVYNLADADMNGLIQFASGTSDITPISASVLNNPANTTADPTLVLTQQLP